MVIVIDMSIGLSVRCQYTFHFCLHFGVVEDILDIVLVTRVLHDTAVVHGVIIDISGILSM